MVFQKDDKLTTAITNRNMMKTLMKMMEVRSAYRGTISFAVIVIFQLGLLASSCTSQSLPDDGNATFCIPPRCHCETYHIPEDDYSQNGDGANCVCPEHGVIPPEIDRDTLVLKISFSDPVVLTRDSLPVFSQVYMLNVTGAQYFLPGAFHGFHSVRFLHLEGNSERVLEADVFDGLTQLAHLTVVATERKKIHSLENGSFTGLNKLKRLNLCGNAISALETDYFRDLEALTTLNMSANKIAELKSDTFVHLLSLNDLDLTDNLIRLVQRNAFRGLTQLKFLRLEGNELRGIPEPTFQAWPLTSDPSNSQMRHISVILHGNPLRCGCHLNWTARWLDEEDKDCVGTCSSPPEFRGHTLSAVFRKTGLKKCRPNNSVISVKAADHVDLACPIGDSAWQTPEGYLLEESGDTNDSYLLSSEGSLIIINASPKNSGNYTCLSVENDDRESYTVGVFVSPGGSLSVTEIYIIVAVVGFVFGGLLCSILTCLIIRKRRNPPYEILSENNIHVDNGRIDDRRGNPAQNQSGVARAASGARRPMTPRSDSDDELNGIVYKPGKSYSKNIPKLNDNLMTIGTPPSL